MAMDPPRAASSAEAAVCGKCEGRRTRAARRRERYRRVAVRKYVQASSAEPSRKAPEILTTPAEVGTQYTLPPRREDHLPTHNVMGETLPTVRPSSDLDVGCSVVVHDDLGRKYIPMGEVETMMETLAQKMDEEHRVKKDAEMEAFAKIMEKKIEDRVDGLVGRIHHLEAENEMLQQCQDAHRNGVSADMIEKDEYMRKSDLAPVLERYAEGLMEKMQKERESHERHRKQIEDMLMNNAEKLMEEIRQLQAENAALKSSAGERLPKTHEEMAKVAAARRRK